MSPDDKLQRARERALPLLRECEGIRLMPYTDAAGLLTVGIGHRTSDRRPITIKRVYELADADMRAAQSAFAELNGALNVNQLAALTSFVFNIGGGAQIYREAWPQTQELDICEVDQSPEADAFFPAVDADEWVEIARDERDGYAFVRYRRRAVDEG